MPPTPTILISGPPASRYIALARRLAADLGMPLISHVDIETCLSDAIGTGDDRWSVRLRVASEEIVWTTLASNLAAATPTILADTFLNDAPAERLSVLGKKFPLVAHQVVCTVDDPTLRRQHEERDAARARLPSREGVDDPLYPFLYRGRTEPLSLDSTIAGAIITVDTTDWAAFNYDGLLAQLRALLRGERETRPHLDGLDHLVLTVRDLDATREWYTRALGMGVVTFDAGRLALTFGAQRINLHEAGREFEPKSAHPTPGSGDLCFYTDTPLDRFVTHLTAAGVPIELGPVPRVGAVRPLRSIYLRDPDDNLIEVANRLTDDEREER